MQSAVPSHLSSPRSRTTTNSDDSDGLVKRNKTGKNLRGVAKQEIKMSGALPLSSDGPSTRQKPIGGKERAEISRAARQPAGSQGTGKATAVDDQQSTQDKPEIQVSASNPKNVETVEPRATQLRSSSRENAFDGALNRPQSSAGLNWRTQATSLADSSMLSLANFKRRPRQPSIVGIGHPDDSLTLSSLGGLEGEDSLLGNDEPSRSKALDFTIMDPMSDFEPENESTPFDASKNAASKSAESRRHDSSSEAASPSSPILSPGGRVVREPDSPGSEFESQLGKGLRMSSTPAAITSSLVGSRKRKITPPEIQVPQSQTSARSEPLAGDKNDILDLPEEEIGDDKPELPSPKRRAPPQPEEWNEYMAPPKSSSPIQESQLAKSQSPAKAATTRGRGRPKRNQSTRVTASKAKKNKEFSGPLSTATIKTHLLSRRLTKRYGEFDIHSDSSSPSTHGNLDEDEDELSYLGPSRRKTARIMSIPKSKRITLAAAKTPKNKGGSRATAATAASTAKSKSKSAPKSAESIAVKRTYGRRNSDKENEPVSVPSGDGNDSDGSVIAALEGDITEDTSMELPEEAKKELSKLREKFEEVDNWGMEFEVVTASSSSPKDAR